MKWLFVKAKGFPHKIYEYYLKCLPQAGDIVIELPTLEETQYPADCVAVLFSDKSDTSYLLSYRLAEQAYGTVFDTGVLVSGALGPAQPPIIIEEGLPMQGYEALILPVSERKMADARWEEPVTRLWPGAAEAIRYVYDGAAAARSSIAAGFPDMQMRWEMSYILPMEDPEVINDLIASVQSMEVSKAAVLGAVPDSVLKQLDNRFTIFVAPTQV